MISPPTLAQTQVTTLTEILAPYAWVVSLGNSIVSYGPKTDSEYVWPVRGGQ